MTAELDGGRSLSVTGSRLGGAFGRAVNLRLREGPGDNLVGEVRTASDRALVLTSRRFLFVRGGILNASAEAVELVDVTEVREERVSSRRTLVVHHEKSGSGPAKETRLSVVNHRWTDVQALVLRAKACPSYGLNHLDLLEQRARLRQARSDLVELLASVGVHRWATRLALDRFSTVGELTLVYGSRVSAQDNPTPRSSRTVTYLSGIGAIEEWLRSSATASRTPAMASKREVRFDDVGRGLLIRVDFPWHDPNPDRLTVGRAVHVRHDTVASATLYENVRGAVYAERTESSGGFASARVFGRYRIGVGGATSVRPELVGRSVLAIVGSGPSGAYRLEFAVKAEGLDAVRYFFEGLYGDRFSFVRDGGRRARGAKGPSVAAELATLAELRRNGDLTDEEFQAAKERLLS